METERGEQSNASTDSALKLDSVVQVDEETGEEGEELVIETEDFIAAEQLPSNEEELQYER